MQLRNFVFSVIEVVSIGVRARLAQGLRGGGGQGHWLDVAKVRLPLCSAQHRQKHANNIANIIANIIANNIASSLLQLTPST
jgi:hypothetical protein